MKFTTSIQEERLKMATITNKAKTKTFQCDHWSPEKLQSHLDYGWTINEEGTTTSKKASSKKDVKETYEETVEQIVSEQVESQIEEDI